jgi:hypothetical protein
MGYIEQIQMTEQHACRTMNPYLPGYANVHRSYPEPYQRTLVSGLSAQRAEKPNRSYPSALSAANHPHRKFYPLVLIT